MPAQLDRLRTAFADQYDIERELGAGGMATVYLARDRKHDRRVADGGHIVFVYGTQTNRIVSVSVGALLEPAAGAE